MAYFGLFFSATLPDKQDASIGIVICIIFVLLVFGVGDYLSFEDKTALKTVMSGVQIFVLGSAVKFLISLNHKFVDGLSERKVITAGIVLFAVTLFLYFLQPVFPIFKHPVVLAFGYLTAGACSAVFAISLEKHRQANAFKT